jgi:hypothetical protein
MWPPRNAFFGACMISCGKWPSIVGRDDATRLYSQRHSFTMRIYVWLVNAQQIGRHERSFVSPPVKLCGKF